MQAPRKEEKAGLYLTLIVHLGVLIVLLAIQIGRELSREERFEMDFSREEQLEEQAARQQLEEEVDRRIEERLKNYQPKASDLKNLAVDAGAALKDDRGGESRDLYEEARRVEEQVRQNAIEEDAREERVELPRQQTEKEDAPAYGGPSVLSYRLDGRKASHLKIPAYRCPGGGVVTVVIFVNPQGTVLDARVMDEASADDRCMREAAVKAAKLSRFSISSSAPARQVGEIVYSFIAQ